MKKACLPQTGEAVNLHFSLSAALLFFLSPRIKASPSPCRMKDESSSSDEDHRSCNQGSGFCQSEHLVNSGNVCYKKTLRLSSEELVCSQSFHREILWCDLVRILQAAHRTKPLLKKGLTRCMDLLTDGSAAEGGS